MRTVIAVLAIMVTVFGHAESFEPSPPLRGARLTFDGLGPLRVGMNIKDVQATGVKLKIHKAVSDSCRQATVSANREVLIMIEKGVLTRVEVRGRSVETLSGIRIGYAEEKVRQAYGSRVGTEPHKYDPNGNYMKIFSADRTKALVFETDGEKVTKFRAGLSESVQYVEGCL